MTSAPDVTRKPLLVLLAGWALGCATGALSVRDSEAAPTVAPPPTAVTTEPGAAGERQAEAFFRDGRYAEAARAFLVLPAADGSAWATERVAAAVSRLGRHAVERIAGLADSVDVQQRDPRFGAVAAELALRFALSGDPASSHRYAEQARRAGVDVAKPPPDPVVVGVILPLTGRPRDREYSELFLEGMRVGVATARLAGLAVELVVEDGRGTVYGSAEAASTLSARGVVAVLGPLSNDNLAAVADAVAADVPVFSPTAKLLPEGRRDVHSLEANGASAARTLANALAALGYADAIVVHTGAPGESMEAAAFLQEFADAGGFSRRIAYAPGTTTFEEPLREAGQMEPEVLVILAPPVDLLLLAPQISFFELDDMNIQVAGTAGWSDPHVLGEVDRRHTDQVVTVSSAPPGSSPEGEAEFRAAYEEHLQKALRSEVPAAGFDLLRIALAAWADGSRTGAEQSAALAGVHRFEGATGTYSLADGSLTQVFFPARICDGELRPLQALALAADTAVADMAADTAAAGADMAVADTIPGGC